MSNDSKPDWWIFRGSEPHDGIQRLLKIGPPPWRQFTPKARAERGARFETSDKEIELVNAAFYLRRPLLITGKPGVGKTSLTYAVARELKLGTVLRWSITTQTTLKDGLYRYDAIARLQDSSLQNEAWTRRHLLRLVDGKVGVTDSPLPGELPTAPAIGNYLRLGPLGTAFAASDKPRVLLIDEIDKSDIDLPNDLLHIFEEGEFEIPELARLPEGQDVIPILPHDAAEGTPGIPITRGRVCCTHFPLVVMTSNGEREFPPAFLRRCLQLEMQLPDPDKLARIVHGHLHQHIKPEHEAKIGLLIDAFVKQRDDKKAELAADQLLNAIYLALNNVDLEHHYRDKAALRDTLWRSLAP